MSEWAEKTAAQIMADFGKVECPRIAAAVLSDPIKHFHVKIRLRFRVRAYKVLRKERPAVWRRLVSGDTYRPYRRNPRRPYIKNRFDPSNPF